MLLWTMTMAKPQGQRLNQLGNCFTDQGRNFQEDPRLQKAAVASNWLMLDVLAQDMPSLRILAVSW